ncbi:similar to Saccharomyces cerevisiae YDR131C F-box protein, substrate-specific adaptor subunit that recruits substrates to a core ubiquitination complex [Maudiozyma barnettii]|uniref:Similar to Saccharomyces cerevisiae YDR131C F-box protein, substrate-specific adaptor subunit that recruits substrates to a core ubiquitination complex n=1 Tax=Maudiozyma barnettii TaxID=61262 RepID=A0A8H2VHU5_9SACH|nr:hypothetical protein [Kazachstania barnettii]CAB4255696.1 similar to Saccharomyces cerevisiae YDR131C F-box protein, substrate-specific adaptor subunit that recruits substrates to a core ubiquitination complex [Kazachstania barnettii]CAD1784257.1 similar to Saccharomyces cerevisiae YDR131C F-box protein, substrate-specific adaptor subunit that recruits substrates to a core ubiquitination complex [Kazachstania barnettii]
MIHRFPSEIWEKIAFSLSQEDKTALSYVSKRVNHLITPILYQNIYLNERYYFPSDYDTSLGTHMWSVLYFTFQEKDLEKDLGMTIRAKNKFQALVRSLTEAPLKLCPMIKRVHCTWHLDQETLISFLTLLNKYDTNLLSFESFIKGEICPYLWKHTSTIQSLNLTPPDMLPNPDAADEQYFKLTRNIVKKYNFDNIQDLTIHVNPLSFFEKGMKKIKIRALCLNLRDDTLSSEPVDDSIHYYDIFDINTLKELEMLSWYNESSVDIDIYNDWKLYDFFKFDNIESLSLLSLFKNEEFIQNCIRKFSKLKKIKIDFMFDATISKNTIDLMSRNKCAKTIRYIDLKIQDMDVPLLSIEDDEVSNFKIQVSCKCDDCKRTLDEVILKKYFPNSDSFIIKDFHDIEQKNFIMQMFKLFTIIPYSAGFDEYPSIGFYSRPLEDFVKKVNSLLNPNPNNGHKIKRDITKSDIIRIYHMYLHSMRKSFDYFLSRFENLEFLILNDIPTKVIQYDEFQRCNVPIFHYYEYMSNQVYELVNDESLFD